MIFAYGKSPLGPVFRFTRKAPVAVCRSRDEAEELIRELGDRISCTLKLLDLETVDEMYEVLLVDPDMGDATSRTRFLILAEWI